MEKYYTHLPRSLNLPGLYCMVSESNIYMYIYQHTYIYEHMYGENSTVLLTCQGVVLQFSTTLSKKPENTFC